jgi:hypothetical protein
MDRLFWKKNWTESSDEEFFARLNDVLDADAWVLDGNYSRSIPLKWKRTEVVIWLDYSLLRILLQALWRGIERSLSQRELWPETGNRESLRKLFFTKESILHWSFTTYAKNKKRYTELMQAPKYRQIAFIRLRNPSAARKFLKEVENWTVRDRTD